MERFSAENGERGVAEKYTVEYLEIAKCNHMFSSSKPLQKALNRLREFTTAHGGR